MKASLTSEQRRFIHYLTGLSKEEDRGTLAVFRRGLSGNPVEDLNLYRFVARYVPEEDRGRPRERLYYLIAALYALNPFNTDKGNFGDHMRFIAEKRKDNDAADQRFSRLLTTRLEDLDSPLRQAVMMIRQQEPPIPINWMQFFSDLIHWEHPEKFSQRAWANSYWGYIPSDEKTSEQSQEPVKEE